jgi:hypothetical protein
VSRVVAKVMAEFSVTKPHLDTYKLSYFTFYPKSLKRVKTVVNHLPINTPVEDICNGLTDLDFNVISVKKISASCRSPVEGEFPVPCNLAQGNEIKGNF